MAATFGLQEKEIKMSEFPSPPVSVTRALVLFVMLTGAAFGQDNASKTYQCSAKDAVSVEDNGTLNKDANAEASRKRFDRMIITVPSGRITYGSHVLETRVAQRSNYSDDYVLISGFYFQRNRTAANATTDFIRLHTAADKPQATFVAFQLSYLVTGTCDIVP